LSELRGDFEKGGKYLRNIYGKVEMDHTFRQDKPFLGFNTETETPEYLVLNAAAGLDVYSPQKQQTLLSIHLSILNITDKTFQNHLSRLKYAAINEVNGRRGVFNAGRNFSIKVNIPLHLEK
jgi:iron complex outermembrane receptor protein